MKAGEKVYCYNGFIYDVCRNNGVNTFPSELSMYPHLAGRWYEIKESHNGEVWIYAETDTMLSNGRILKNSPFGYMNYSLKVKSGMEYHPYYFGYYFFTLKEYRKLKLNKLALV